MSKDVTISLYRRLRERVIRENDYLEFPYNIQYDSSRAKAYPFFVYDGKMHVGRIGTMHIDLMTDVGFSRTSMYSFDGRIWSGPKVITFWEWPKNLKQFLNNLVREAKKQQGVNIDLKTWRIEVRDPKTKKFLYLPIPHILSKEVDVERRGKSVALKHLQSPMNKKREPTPPGIGSRKQVRGSRPGEVPAQTHYRLGVLAEETIKVGSDEFDRVELKLGVAVEMEHTDDRKEALKIALDHLKEDPKYYSKLNKAGLIDEPEAEKIAKELDEETERDYKKEYEKYQSSDKMKKYRAQLNKYNRDKGTYGNGDKKDASHKNGKIKGFEDESKNRGRAEKSRLKGSKRNL